MPWHPTLTDVRNVLADLYPRDPDIRTFLDSVGLDDARIAFDPRAVNTWHAVLDEADKQGKLEDVLRGALAAFPRWAPLADAVAAYHRALGGGPAGASPVGGAPTGGGPGPAPAARRWKLTPQQKGKLVDALLQCPTVAGRGARDAMVNDLRDEIKHSAQRHDNARLDVNNLISTALNYAGGLEELVEALRLYEGDSFPMQEVDRALAALG